MTCAAPRTDSKTRRHREILFISTVVLVLALVLEVRADQRVFFRGYPEWPLPETCLSRSWLHIECPGCGLTRSIVHLAHCQWGESWRMHRLGWLLALTIGGQIPYRLVALCTGNPAPLGVTFPRLFGWTLLALLAVNWLMKLLASLTV